MSEPLDLEPHWSLRRTWRERALDAEQEVERLRAELARRDEQIAAVRARDQQIISMIKYGHANEAAILEGFRCIAIEREADYLPLITQRINRRLDPITYLTAAGEDLGIFDFEEPA